MLLFRIVLLLASTASVVSVHVAHTRSRGAPKLLVPARSSRIGCSLFANSDPSRTQRLQRVAALYNLDPEKDGSELVARAASSLPEEENGDWRDVAVCTLRNAVILSAFLTALGALPNGASAVVEPVDTTTLSASLVVADLETLDVIASIVVPLLVGGALVAFAAANYEKLIDKLNEGR